MIMRKWKKAEAAVVTLTVTIACVKNHKPLVGFSDSVEKAWRALKRKHRLKDRDAHQLCKVSSSAEVLERQSVSSSTPVPSSPLIKSSTASEIGRVMLKFKEMEAAEVEGKKEDVYSNNYVPKKYSKASSEYGTPKPGTLTEMRAKKASKHIAKEMLYLCEMIQEYGYQSRRTGQTHISFGKVVGMLLRARKHKMVEFEGEMLFQRRDEEVVISLLLSPEEIQTAYKNL